MQSFQPGQQSCQPAEPSPANDNRPNPFDPTDPGGGSALRAPRLLFFKVEGEVSATVLDKAIQMLDEHEGWPSSADEQLALALAFTSVVRSELPEVYQALGAELARGRVDALIVSGLPTQAREAKLIMLALDLVLGSPFNFEAQNDGQLVMELIPSLDAGDNTNATPGEFAMHTDDAAVPPGCRAHFICLYGLVNPPETYTYYAPLNWAVSEMVQRDPVQAQKDIITLMSDRFSIRFPESLGAGDVWCRGRSVITLGQGGRMELGFPSYNTRPDDPEDYDALLALENLHRSLETVKKAIAVDPGIFLAFSNLRGTHARDELGASYRKILRTYATESLAQLSEITCVAGPVFPIKPIADFALRNQQS